MIATAPRTGRRYPLELVTLLVLAALALGWGWQQLVLWSSTGFTPGARGLGDVWPACLWVGLALAVLPVLLPRPRAPESSGSTGPTPTNAWLERLGGLTLALVSWSLAVDLLAALPDHPNAVSMGAGPILRPFFLVLLVAACWYAHGAPLGPGRRLLDHRLAERGLVLFVLWSTANGKLFMLSGISGFALLLIGGLTATLLLVAGQGLGTLMAGLRARLGRPLLLLFCGLPLWWWICSHAGVAPEPSLRLAWRLIVLALLALAAIGATPTERAPVLARRLFGALVLGLGLVLVATLLGILEACRFHDLGVVLGSRLRVLSLHPNLGGALLGLGLPLALGWIFMGAREGSPISARRRALGALLVAGLGTGLYLTDSRASLAGGVLGVLVFGFAFRSRLAARVGPRSLVAFGLAGAAAVALLVSPLGGGLRAELDQRALTQSALGQRWHIWKMASAALDEHPLTGIGPLFFQGHAQYAEPSYYDGTSQTLHTHNIFMAAAEGAGWPGLLLLVLFVGALVELLRRAIAAAPPGHPDRALAAALLGAVVGLFASNQLDLGQSQMTFLPMLFWFALIAAALLGAGRASAPAATRSKLAALPAALVVLLLAWPAAGSTLVGYGLMASANFHVQDGRPDAGVRLYERLLGPGFASNRIEVRRRLAAVHERAGRFRKQAAVLAEGTAEQPESSLAWQRYAQALLDHGDFAEGARAAARAHAKDPRGTTAAANLMLRAWAEFGLGNRAAASDFFIEAVAGGAKPLPGMATQSVRVDAADPSAGDSQPEAQLAFVVGTGPASVPILELLDELGRRTVELAASDQVAARRRLTGLVEGFEFAGRPAGALRWIRAVIAASPQPIRATVFQEVQLLVALGREEEATQVWRASSFGQDVDLGQSIVGVLAGGQGGELAVGVDLFFVAGQMTEMHLGQALDNAARGDRAGAHAELGRAAFNAKTVRQRVRMFQRFLVEASATREEKLEDLGAYLAMASTQLKSAIDRKAHREAGQVLLLAFDGDGAALLAAVEPLAAEHPQAGEIFLVELNKLLRPRRGAAGAGR